MHASGPMCHMSHGPEELYFWPVIWIRGNGGHWHATAHPARQTALNPTASRHLTGRHRTSFQERLKGQATGRDERA